jgi:hypothetical protein
MLILKPTQEVVLSHTWQIYIFQLIAMKLEWVFQVLMIILPSIAKTFPIAFISLVISPPIAQIFSASNSLQGIFQSRVVEERI